MDYNQHPKTPGQLHANPQQPNHYSQQPSPYQQQANPQYGAPVQPPAPQKPREARLHGWAAHEYGLETGKHIEVDLIEIANSRGGTFKLVKFFKPYFKDNEWKKYGLSVPSSKLNELVDRINFIASLGLNGQPGVYVFQPQAYPAQGVPAPQGQPQAPGFYTPPNSSDSPPVNSYQGQAPSSSDYDDIPF